MQPAGSPSLPRRLMGAPANGLGGPSSRSHTRGDHPPAHLLPNHSRRPHGLVRGDGASITMRHRAGKGSHALHEPHPGRATGAISSPRRATITPTGTQLVDHIGPGDIGRDPSDTDPYEPDQSSRAELPVATSMTGSVERTTKCIGVRNQRPSKQPAHDRPASWSRISRLPGVFPGWAAKSGGDVSTPRLPRARRGR
jgi:hypothetical protein